MQDSDIPTKLIKNNSGLFVDFLFTNLNDSMTQSTFPSLPTLANIISVHKNTRKHQKVIIGQLVYYQGFQKYVRGKVSKYFEPFFSKSSAVLGKVFASAVSFEMRNVLEKWKLVVDNQKKIEAFFTDPSYLNNSHMTS